MVVVVAFDVDSDMVLVVDVVVSVDILDALVVLVVVLVVDIVLDMVDILVRGSSYDLGDVDRGVVVPQDDPGMDHGDDHLDTVVELPMLPVTIVAGVGLGEHPGQGAGDSLPFFTV